jgi:hypothetical protein
MRLSHRDDSPSRSLAGLLLGLAIAALAGCKEPAPPAALTPAPRPPPSAGASAVASAVATAAPVSPEDASELFRSWKTAAAGLALAEAAPPAAPLTYAIATCPLTYELQGGSSVGTSGAGAPFVTLFAARFDTQSEPKTPARWDLHNAWIRFGSTHPGGGPEELLLGPRGPSFGADIHLVTDGRSFSEVDGPTLLWSAFANAGGLVYFWPALPPSSAPESPTAWQIKLFLPSASRAVEAARGFTEDGTRAAEGGARAGAPRPKSPPATGTTPPTLIDATVKLRRWITVAARPAVLLDASWGSSETTTSDASGIRMSRTRARKGTGFFVVLASGRLLFAAIDDISQSADEYDGNVSGMQQRVSGELRLVTACDGPTLPALHGTPGADELAWLALAGLQEALRKENGAAAAALFTAAVRQKHGDAALGRALLSFQKAYSTTVFGNPRQPASAAHSEGGAWRVSFQGSTIQGYSYLMVNGDVFFEVANGAARIRSISMSTANDEKKTLCDVSETRLVVETKP